MNRPKLPYIFILPGFFIAFAFVYNPFDIQAYYSFGNLSFAFHLVMLTCIQMLVLASFRLPIHFWAKKGTHSKLDFILLSVGELFVASCFMALYTQLFKHNDGGWFESLAVCLKFSFLILCYPVIFYYIHGIIKEKEGQIEKASTPLEDNSLARFYDEHKRLKLTIAPSSILYIESMSNYIVVHYVDAGNPKEFQIRCSMKSIELTMEKHGLVRCHRSFFVNPSHVRLMRKDSDSITYVQLSVPNVPQVPISKQYHQVLSSRL